MPRSTARVRLALTDEHLKAIGAVAASWSDLEFTLMYLVVQESDTHPDKAIAMIAGQGVQPWLRMLRLLLTMNGLEWKWTALTSSGFEKRLVELQRKRNDIVHAVWRVPEPLNKLAQLVLKLKHSDLSRLSPPPPKVAKGLGFKRGKDVSIVSFSAEEMRAVAKQIAEVREELHAWSALKQPAPTTPLLGQARRDRQTPSRKQTPPRSQPG